MKRIIIGLVTLSLILFSFTFVSCVTAPTPVPTTSVPSPSNTAIPPTKSPETPTPTPTPTPPVTTPVPTPTLAPGTGGLKILNGADVTDIAESSDGSLIYVVDAETATGNVYKSSDGGYSFTVLKSPASVALTHVRVAPDNLDVIAVTDGVSVYISIDGGDSWDTLPAFPTPWTGASILDISVSPAISGTLFGREYAVAISDPLPGVTARGDILIIGEDAKWDSAGADAGSNKITGTRDYVAVTFTPGFASDRSVVAIGVGTAGGSAAVEVINTDTDAVVSRASLNTSGTTGDFGTPATGVVSGSLSLPGDFEATGSRTRTGYAGIASASPQADNDVYRFNDTSAVKLGAVNSLRIHSVSFSGTVSGGTLFAGLTDDADIRYTSNPTASSPDWIATEKLLVPSVNDRTVVLTARDFPVSNTVFAGTSGPKSGFSVSTSGGIGFDQTALID